MPPDRETLFRALKALWVIHEATMRVSPGIIVGATEIAVYTRIREILESCPQDRKWPPNVG
jgi:hypothetical protein